MIDPNEFAKTQERRANAAEIKALALTWENRALREALTEANEEIERLGGRPVPEPEVL
jgi:hypothetical protein